MTAQPDEAGRASRPPDATAAEDGARFGGASAASMTSTTTAVGAAASTGRFGAEEVASAGLPGAEPGTAQRPAGPAQAWAPALGVLLGAFNHVLGQHAWARERLAPFAGQVVRTVTATPLGEVAAAAAIQSDGTLQAAASGAVPAVTLMVRAPLDALVAFAGAGSAAAMQHLRIEGDAALAAAIGQIAPHLRWDAEDDLSRVVGDVAARRVTGLVDRVRSGLRDLRMRGESAATAYLLHEDPQLVAAPMLDGLRSATRTLRDDLERLDKRIERLERART